MKVFVNENYEIIDVDSTTNEKLTEFEINGDTFKGKCIAFIRGYKCVPLWKVAIDSETGEPKVDEDGNEVYEVDENGNKVSAGFGVYPFWDFNQLSQIQLEYENQQLVYALANIIGGIQQ